MLHLLLFVGIGKNDYLTPLQAQCAAFFECASSANVSGGVWWQVQRLNLTLAGAGVFVQTRASTATGRGRNYCRTLRAPVVLILARLKDDGINKVAMKRIAQSLSVGDLLRVGHRRNKCFFLWPAWPLPSWGPPGRNAETSHPAFCARSAHRTTSAVMSWSWPHPYTRPPTHPTFPSQVGLE